MTGLSQLLGDRARSWTRSTVEVVKAIAREWRDDRVTGLAAEIAFFGVLSLFPALVALTAALGSLAAVAGRDAAEQVESGIVTFLERFLTDEANTTIEAVRHLFEEGNADALTFGTAAALWAASRGFVAVINGLDVAYDIEEGRPYLHRRAVALGLAVGTVVVIAVMLVMLVVGPLLGTGQDVADYVGLGSGFATFWDWIRWPTALAVMGLWAATIFHFGPNHRTPWRWDLPGAALTTAAWVLVSVGFRIYLAAAGEVNQVLGTLGGALILLLWLFVLAIGLLLGGELNAVLAERHVVQQVPRRRPLRLRRRADRTQGGEPDDRPASS